MLIRTVCRTTVGVNAASAAVPNGQDDERHTSAEGPLGRLRALDNCARLEWPCGNAWIAVALPRVDVSVNGGNNTPTRHAVHITVT
jgi:hypothetical protein